MSKWSIAALALISLVFIVISGIKEDESRRTRSWTCCLWVSMTIFMSCFVIAAVLFFSNGEIQKTTVINTTEEKHLLEPDISLHGTDLLYYWDNGELVSSQLPKNTTIVFDDSEPALTCIITDVEINEKSSFLIFYNTYSRTETKYTYVLHIPDKSYLSPISPP